ncbi:hybrid sensor histidine kinase/response regulator transcription factor [Flammeovirga kamogawensis]|uniref:histidine kinase n=1 Tax=Flammeovirga kamogawensis TaxID=373891 RepID=A0ABX8H1A9_9BACT|nr:response regulator [Flammeovirga kamogawensis]MBB6462583.1 signal transduction histidine kinase/DNA-binding response OmpR family regulator/tetratricopeptide (TPR) repeat protein [Flammeovirga kamogawensis]QWG09670.1 response regulator [Flammeovirga kamogawensis]TRX65184.1 response regulator [Flammeovirga kamogawensis]
MKLHHFIILLLLPIFSFATDIELIDKTVLKNQDFIKYDQLNNVEKSYYSALQQIKARNYDACLKSFDSLLQQNIDTKLEIAIYYHSARVKRDSRNYQEAYDYYTKCTEYTNEHNNAYIAKSIFFQGAMKNKLFQYEEATELLKKGINKSIIEKDTLLLYSYYYEMLSVTRSQSNYYEAMNYGLKGSELALTQKNENQKARFDFAIGIISQNLNDYKKAREYFKKAEDVFKKDKASYQLALLYYNQYIIAKDSDGQIKINKLDAAKKMFSEIGVQQFDNKILLEYAYIYFKIQKNNELGYKYLVQLQEKFDNSNISEEIKARTNYYFAIYEGNNGYLNKALKYCEAADKLYPNKNGAYYQTFLRTYSKILKKAGNYKKSLTVLEKYNKLIDQRYVENAEYKIAKIQADYRIKEEQLKEEQEFRIEVAKQAQLVEEKDFKAKGLFIILALMLVFLSVLGFTISKIKKINKELSNKNQEINSQNDQLAKSSNELKKLNELRINFFHAISHEFKTPLTLIKAPTDLLLLDNISGQKEHINQILRNTNKLMGLVNQLLQLGRLQSQQKVIDFEWVDFEKLNRRILFAFESLAKKENIIIKSLFHSETKFGFIDIEAYESILNNLISNAIKYSKGSEINILGELQRDQLVIKVIDNGNGIEEKHLPHIFDTYYVAKENNEISTGLGLSITKELTKQLNGTIGVSSKIGKGTEFILNIPVELHNSYNNGELVKEEKQETSIQLQNDGTNEGIKHDKHILIVEDNDDIRKYLKLILETNYKIKEARNGIEGLEKINEEIPDIIITDLMMPEMDGITFSKEVKSNPIASHVPIIMLTAKDDEDTKLTALEEKVTDFLSKPFNHNELLLKIKNTLEYTENLQKKYVKYAVQSDTIVELPNVDQQFIEKLNIALENEINNADFSIEELANIMCMSRNHLYRKIKGLLGLSPSNYIKQYRLEQSLTMVKSTLEPFSNIAYDTGFNSVSYFNTSFKEYFGKTPSECREASNQKKES